VAKAPELDPESETWAVVKAAVCEQMKLAQAKINARSAHDETEYQRGRRDLAEDLLTLETPRAPIEQRAAIDKRSGV